MQTGDWRFWLVWNQIRLVSRIGSWSSPARTAVCMWSNLICCIGTSSLRDCIGCYGNNVDLSTFAGDVGCALKTKVRKRRSSERLMDPKQSHGFRLRFWIPPSHQKHKATEKTEPNCHILCHDCCGLHCVCRLSCCSDATGIRSHGQAHPRWSCIRKKSGFESETTSVCGLTPSWKKNLISCRFLWCEQGLSVSSHF